jgi:putative ABC transport system permease protein
MLRNYINIALRNIRNNSGYTLLNVTGLAVSLAVAALIILYLKYEKSYDKWLGDDLQVYRVYRQWGTSEGGSAWTPPPLRMALQMQFPEIRHATQLYNQGEALVQVQGTDKSLYVKGSVATDSSFLAVLPLPLRYGDAHTALQKPYSALLSSVLAAKLFGDQDPVGKVLRYNDKTDYRITGVLASFPAPFHLEGEVYLTDPEVYFESWTGNSPATYVSIIPNTNLARLEQKITEGINPYLRKELIQHKVNVDDLPNWRLQPLQDIHLYSTRMGGPFESRGDYRSLYILSGVALLILVIACINYMNLATAQAVKRAKEVGVRKVNGAGRPQLIVQFLAEAVLQSAAALPLAAALAILFLPAFNTITDRNLSLTLADWQQISGYWSVLVLILGLVSGSYPAFFLSAYQPVAVLKGNLLRGSRGQGIRQSLVITQFSIAITVAIVMTFIYKQVQFMVNQQLGFQPEQVVVIPVNTAQTGERIEAFKSQVLANMRIREIAYAASLPGTGQSDNGFQIAGIEKNQDVNVYCTSPDYARALGLTISQGRFFSYEHSTDTANAFVVNEAFVREYGLKNPIGHQMKFSFDKEYGSIIGVVRDFNYQSLQKRIEPLVFNANFKRHGNVNYAIVRLTSQEMPATLAYLKKQWQQIEPAHPMRYSFLDDNFAKLYDKYTRLGHTMLYATLLTIFIACLGLFGLASFMAEQRTKEIGIRKVLGASEWQLVLLLGKKFLTLVGIASLVAIPLAFWIARQWLADFAYRTSITAVPFLFAAGLALLVAALTVSFRSYRAALANPVKSLRAE